MKFSDAQLQEALSNRFVVKRYGFPGFEGKFIAVKALSDAEMDGCRMRATEHVKRSKMAFAVELAVDPDFFQRALHREIVAAACRDPEHFDDYFFSRADEVAQLDNQTVMALIELFKMHQNALDPYTFASEEEVNELVEQLGKSESDAESLSLFDAVTLRSCVLSLASIVRSMRRLPSSATG